MNLADSSSQLTAGRFSVRFDALTFTASRSSGPGGQNVNKQNTRVELRLSLSAIDALDAASLQRLRMLAGKRLVADDQLRFVSQQTRSQEQNRALAIRQLQALLEEVSRVPRKRKATKPTGAARRRRVEGKKHRGQTKAERREVRL